MVMNVAQHWGRFKSVDMSKKDQKLFQDKLSGWQEKYIEGLVKGYMNFPNDDTQSMHQRNSRNWKRR